MKRKNDTLYRQAMEIRHHFELEIQDTLPPETLVPEEVDNIIKRGNNLRQERKTAAVQKKKQHRPMRMRILAAVMSFLLVAGIGVGAVERLQDDNSGSIVSKAIIEQAIYADSGLQSVAVQNNVAADDYTPITEYLKEIQKENKKREREAYDLFDVVNEALTDGMEASDESAETVYYVSASQTGFSDTNNQVENVQEGDIVKTDGRYLYLLSSAGALYCEQIQPDGGLVQTDVIESVANVEKGNAYGLEMFLYEEHLAVTVQYNTDLGPQVEVQLYRVEENGTLSETGSYGQGGYYVSARLTGGVLYLITHDTTLSVYQDYDQPEDYVPLVWNDEAVRMVTTEEMYISGCPDTAMRFTTVSGYCLGDAVDQLQVTSVLGSTTGTVYCTEETLYLLGHNNYYRQLVGNSGIFTEKTVISSFALQDGKAVALAQGTVAGRMLNQFSADEYDGMLRIATTDETACRVTVLDASLQPISELTGLAEGEDIYACKFMGDTAYLVTFYQTDPLFVLDLTDVMNMKVVGELKIPGYSNYLYPVGENYLIGVGQNADENGWVDGLRVNLFDVSDPSEPKLADVKILYGDSSSLAGETHKAYYVDAENGLVGFPIYCYGSDDGRERFNGFVMFSVQDGKLNVVKEFNYLENTDGLAWDTAQNHSYSTGNYRIQRGVYVGETLYLLADNAVCSIYAYNRTDFVYLNRFDLN